MSSNIMNAIKNYRKNLHNVGSLNSWGKTVLNQGAVVVGSDIDNYELVKLGFNNAGERTCERLVDNAEGGMLIASVEDYMKEFETIASFFNAEGERARIVYLEKGRRFECSNFSVADSNKAIKNGQVAHYDVDTKTYLISNGETNHEGYANAANKFIVVDAAPVSLDGKQLIRFEIA